MTANENFDTSADANNNGIQDGSEPPIIGTLNGFQDWGALIYNFRTVTDFTTAGATTDQEPDPQTLDNAHQAFTRMVQPKLISTLMGPSAGVPGAALTFNARLENPPVNGARGPAMNVVAVALHPDGTTQTTDIDTLALGPSSTLRRPTSCRAPPTMAPSFPSRSDFVASTLQTIRWT